MNTIFSRNYINLINPATGTRPLPDFGQIDIKRTDGVSSFNAWQTSMQRQFYSGWLLSANYMWSHSLNDGAVGGGEGELTSGYVAARKSEVPEMMNLLAAFRT